MTPDDIRARLRAALAGATLSAGLVECPTCHGSGHIVRTARTLTQADVAEAIGIGRTGVANFLASRQTFGMDVTLRLLDFLDHLPAAPDTVDEPTP